MRIDGAGRPGMAAACALLLVGCATLDRGSDDRLFVVSEPAGATATLSTGGSCVTPCSIVVSRRAEFEATVAKAGYESRTVEIRTRPNAVGIGDAGENLMNGGIGIAVDAATGALLEHVPNPLNVTLRPLAGHPKVGTAQAAGG